MNAMGNAVTATVNNSSAAFYNPAGLARLNDGERWRAKKELEDSDAEAKRKEEEAKLNKEVEKKKTDANGTEKLEDQKIESEIDLSKSDAVDPRPWYKKIGSKFLEGFGKNLLKNNYQVRPSQGSNELNIQYHYVKPSLTSSAPNTEKFGEILDHHATIGLGFDLNKIYNLNRGFRFGLNLIVPATGSLLKVNDQNPVVHKHLQYGDANTRPVITGGFGFEVWKNHLFVGAGFTALFTGGGAILLRDVPISPNPVAPNQQVVLELKPMVNPTAGAQFVWGKFNLGASYRRETFLKIDPLSARAQTTLLNIQLDLDIAILDLYSPRTISYGFGFRPFDNVLLTFDVNRELWSLFRLSRTKQAYSEAPGLHDTVNYRGGLEWRITDSWITRAGYARRPTPLNDQRGRNNYMDFDRNIVTGGVTYMLLPGAFKFLKGLENPIAVDFVVEYQKLHGRSIIKDNPTPTNPNYSSGGNVWHAGISFTFFI